MKHNKKRNTAFLYETLVQELTKSIVNKEDDKKKKIISILKENFSVNTILNKELSLYKTIKEVNNVKKQVAEKIILETKIEYDSLSKEKIFKYQSKVINRINKELGVNVFSNFVKDYKDLATISQVFNGALPIKERVLLEEELIQKMCENKSQEKEMMPLDKLTFKTFINKFNEKYSDSLLKEQKELLTNYLISFSDNELSLKIFLNEELERVKKILKECLEIKEIKEDEKMYNKTSTIMEKLELFKKKKVDQKMLSELLKIQSFVYEAKKDV